MTPDTPLTGEPRIAPADTLSEEQTDLLSKTLLGAGEPLNIFRTLARHPALLKRFNVLGGFFLTRGTLPARERELVILRTAWHCRSEYEFGQHVVIGRDVGLEDAEIRQVVEPVLGSRWAPSDEVLLRFTDELVADRDVHDVTWQGASAILDEQQLLELICLVGFYQMVAGLLRTLRVTPERHLPSWQT